MHPDARATVAAVFVRLVLCDFARVMYLAVIDAAASARLLEEIRALAVPEPEG
jgi:hypothetical protein